MKTQPSRQTYHAPRVYSYSRRCLAAVVAILVMCSTLASFAIGVNIREYSKERFTFDVIWTSTVLSERASDSRGGPGGSVGSVDVRDFGSYVMVSPHSHFGGQAFDIGLDPARHVHPASSHLDNFHGLAVMPFDLSYYGLSGVDPHGLVFVYGSAGVPDTGSTAMLLVVSLVGLTLGRRTLLHR